VTYLNRLNSNKPISEKVNNMKYINGLYAKKKHNRAPDFVICNGSINKKQMQETLNQMEGEWLNFQFLTPYSPDEKYPDRLTVKIDDYKKDEPKQVASAPVDVEEDIPF
jgi:hypothetical protein